MTRDELFKSLAKKHIDSFHTSVLGFTLGSLMDRGATAEEVRCLCALLLDQIVEAVKNPETKALTERLTSIAESAARN